MIRRPVVVLDVDGVLKPNRPLGEDGGLDPACVQRDDPAIERLPSGHWVRTEGAVGVTDANVNRVVELLHSTKEGEMIIEIKSKSVRGDDAVVNVVVDGVPGTATLVFTGGRWVVDQNETRTWFSSSLAGLGFERLDALRRSVEKYMGSR